MTNILKKSILICLFYYSAVLISSCCTKEYYKSYSLKDMTISNVVYNFLADSNFNVQHIDTTHYKTGKYGIHLSFPVEYLTRLDGGIDFNLITKSYAWTCPVSDLKPVEAIAKITVTTIENFSSAYPARSDVSGLFVMPEYNANLGKINKKPLSGFELPILMGRSGSDKYLDIDLYLDDSPETPREVQFDIEIALTNGNMLKGQTRKVLFTE